MLLPLKHRAAFAKFRCGTAPIRIETGRYERLPEADRLCPFCTNEIENEVHVIVNCSLYDDIRVPLFNKSSVIDPMFTTMSDADK